MTSVGLRHICTKSMRCVAAAAAQCFATVLHRGHPCTSCCKQAMCAGADRVCQLPWSVFKLPCSLQLSLSGQRRPSCICMGQMQRRGSAPMVTVDHNLLCKLHEQVGTNTLGGLVVLCAHGVPACAAVLHFDHGLLALVWQHAWPFRLVTVKFILSVHGGCSVMVFRYSCGMAGQFWCRPAAAHRFLQVATSFDVCLFTHL